MEILRLSFKLKHVVIIGGIVCYLELFTYNSLTRTRLFSPDSMNYVDVARNIASGKGIVQSTLGFSQIFLFNEKSQIPTPFTTQAPLYPILIALLSKCGIEYQDSALIIPVIGYGLILLLGYFLSQHLFGKQIALLTLGWLLISPSLSFVSRFAWSEGPAIVFLLLCLLLLVKSCQLREPKLILLFAGLTGGIAFAVRYIMFLLFALGFLFLVIEYFKRKLKFRIFIYYILGGSLPIGLVLTHNLLSTGQLLPSFLPSDISFLNNLQYLLLAFFREHFIISKTTATIAFLIGIFLVIRVILQQKIAELITLFIKNGHYLLLMWITGYTAFLVFYRTIFHFDYIDNRLMSPAIVILIILETAFLGKAIEPILRHSLTVVILIIFVVVGREIWVMITKPIINSNQRIAQSERLSWIAKHTTDKDLIIGENTVDIPFYFENRKAVTFYPYPYTVYLTYPTLIGFIANNCSRYQNIYLILIKYPIEKDYYGHLYRFGQFITDLRLGNISKYPKIILVATLKNIYVFKISCK